MTSREFLDYRTLRKAFNGNVMGAALLERRKRALCGLFEFRIEIVRNMMGGPGKLLWSENSEYCHFYNFSYVFWLTKVWLQQYLTELFVKLVWMVSLNEEKWMCIYLIEAELSEYNFTNPVSYIDIKKSKITYHYYTLTSITQSLRALKLLIKQQSVDL